MRRDIGEPASIIRDDTPLLSTTIGQFTAGLQHLAQTLATSIVGMAFMFVSSCGFLRA